MVIIGVLLIVAVLLDAWRRIRSDKNAHVKVKLVDPEEVGSERDEQLAWLKELPNGGARVVNRGDIQLAAGHTSDNQSQPVANSAGTDPQPNDAPGNLDNASDSDNLDWLDGLAATGDSPVKELPHAGKLPRAAASEVFVLNVVARNPAGFRGEDILHILLACDLRFGDMNFFHRHENEAGRGAIQFSVANMMEPGVFEIDNMAQMHTPGLVFFVTLPGPQDMMQAFDYMLEAAQAVARNLGGDVLDESRSVITRQATEHRRQQIRELEQRLLAKAR